MVIANYRVGDYGLPVVVSVGMHVVVIAMLAMNLSFCECTVDLPPVPEHVRAVVVEHSVQRRVLTPEITVPDIEVPEHVDIPDIHIPPPDVKPLAPTDMKPAPAKPVPLPNDIDKLLAQDDAQKRARENLRRETAKVPSAAENNMHALQDEKTIAESEALIAAEIERRWVRPPTTRPGMVAEFRIELLPGGDIRDIRLTKSSGDTAFDKAAENAIRVAGRLPVPHDPVLFNSTFRHFNFRFRPEDLPP